MMHIALTYKITRFYLVHRITFFWNNVVKFNYKKIVLGIRLNSTQKLVQELSAATSFIYSSKIFIPTDIRHSNRHFRDVGGKRSEGTPQTQHFGNIKVKNHFCEKLCVG